MPKINEDRIILRSKKHKQYQEMFSRVAELAIREAKAHGLPVTSVEDGKIIREYSNGEKEVLGTVPPPVTYPKRTYTVG